MAEQRKVMCPFCEGKVLAKNEARETSSLQGFIQRYTSIVIPTGVQQYLKSITPVNKSSIHKDKCPRCGNSRTIVDPADDSARYAEVESRASTNQEKITELEKLLAPPGGNRHTILQGNDFLEVGLGINMVPSYRVVENGGVRNKGLIDPSKINPDVAGPQIPEGATANHIQGWTPLPSPGGNYIIKCANKFTLISGAHGVEIQTGGPITFNGGITKIIGAEIAIGSQSGRVAISGDVVDIGGKSVEVAPTDGHFFVKGTISNTGNVMVGGHTHSESISFVKGECVGTNGHTKIAAPSDLYTGPAFWGGVGVEGVTASLKDLMGFTLSKSTNPVEAQQLLTPRFMQTLTDKIAALSYNMRPWEAKPTGFILPGTFIGYALGFLPVVTYNPVSVYNFPHTHALHDMAHYHEVRLPKLDYSADTAAQLRAKQGGVSASAPLHKTSGKASNVATSLFKSMYSLLTTWPTVGGSGVMKK